ncbi:hypothetical protein LINGRAHAP2_LOCUS18306 [Linum grandiflorum]
MFSCNLTRL